jgi:hypothetical protein
MAKRAPNEYTVRAWSPRLTCIRLRVPTLMRATPGDILSRSAPRLGGLENDTLKLSALEQAALIFI